MSPALQGRRGMAVAPHALASQSALAVLREGGNALEAMVAAAATIAVVYPHMNGIGGDSFWLMSLGGDGRTLLGVEGCGAAAQGIHPDHYAGSTAIPFRGPQAAITVAGTISAWARTLEISRTRLGGRMPLSRLLADAIDYARHGTPMTASQARLTQSKLADLAPLPGFADTFVPGGNVPAVGSLFVQPRMADTLAQLAHAGLDDFYRGDLARSMATDLQALGSPLTLADLQAHYAVDRTPLALAHSLGRLYNMPPPTQGLVSLIIVGLMDRLPATASDHLGADYVHCAVEAVKQGFAVRDRVITDPAAMQGVDPRDFLTPTALDAMAARIDLAHAAPWGQGKGPADTVWLGVVDGAGNAVSMIQSIYHEFGAGIVLPGSGVNWQNRGASFSLDPAHINVLAPGKKPFHTLNPALAHLDDGRTIVYGNMGGDGQPQTQSAVFTRVAQHGLDPQAAIAAPRWLLGRTWGQTSDSLKLEARFPSATVEALRARGHEVELLADYDEACGHAGCIVRHPQGTLQGGSDPRSDGGVAAF